jgi:tryptophan synthase alpha chain
MTRIGARFAELAAGGRTGFITYITAGDPSLEATLALVLEFERRGVDVVELGVPFSDPIADGPANQAGAERALRNGVTLRGVLDLVRRLRECSEIPIVLFTYTNPIHKLGADAFAAEARDAGVDGVLFTDLPPEEADAYAAPLKAVGLDTIFLIAPTSPADRIAHIAERSRGFIYLISRLGVTGERKRLDRAIGPMLARIREATDKPVAVGFGVSRPEHVRELAGVADAVVVGSAIVSRIGEWGAEPDLVARTGEFVGGLMAPLQESASGERTESGA